VPPPRGSLDLKAQTYYSRTRPSPRLDKGGASRKSTRALSLSELCSRRHSPPISLKRERGGGAMRRPAQYHLIVGEWARTPRKPTQAAAPSARSRFQSARKRTHLYQGCSPLHIWVNEFNLNSFLLCSLCWKGKLPLLKYLARGEYAAGSPRDLEVRSCFARGVFGVRVRQGGN